MENNNRMARHYENQFDNLKLENERNRKIVKSAFKTMQDNYDKLKEDNANLLNALKESYAALDKIISDGRKHNNRVDFYLFDNWSNYIHKAVNNAIMVIKQAESK